MIILISGPSGSGKTTSALDFAQEPGSVFLIGEEGNANSLRSKAAAMGKDVSQTLFYPAPPNMSELLVNLQGFLKAGSKRIALDDFQMLRDLENLPQDWQSRMLMGLVGQHDAQILVTVRSGRLSGIPKLGTPMESLIALSSYWVRLDAPKLQEKVTRPTGVLEKNRFVEDPSEICGIALSKAG